MKQIIYSLLIFFLAFTIISCGDDDGGDGSAADGNTARLAHEWTVGEAGSVSRNDNDYTSDFKDFSIRFSTSNSYIIQGDPDNVLYPSGTWQFNGDNSSQILLNSDPNAISIQFADDDQTLIMSFIVSENNPIGSKVAGISGEYIFRLSRNN